jgi:hypothetical protein
VNSAPFWLDWHYDRDRADTGTSSRYGNYLRQHDHSFNEIYYDNPAVEFAATAWRIATGPIMSPPLVFCHQRIATARVFRSEWNGEMVANIQLVSPRPQALANARTTSGAWYHDQHLNAWDSYEGIGDSLVRNAYMLTEVRMLWQMPAGTVPAMTAVPAPGPARFGACIDALIALLDELNREISPILDKLESDR